MADADESPPAGGSHGDEVEPLDAIVLGAGISGLVSASILVDQGNSRILVVDEYRSAGGNHLDFTYGPYTFDVGSLIFQDDSPLLQHFPELLSRYVAIDPRWSRLNPQGRVTEYPFSYRDDFLSAGPFECARLVLSAVAGRLRYRHPRNARDFARRWIGPRLLRRSGLESYMTRFCGLPPERIELQFAEQRMMWIAEHATAASLGRRVLHAWRSRRSGRAGSAPPGDERRNQQLARPPEGFAHLYRPAVERLETRGVEFAFGARADRLSREGALFRLDIGGRVIRSRRVLSTIPLDRALDLIGASSDEQLPTVTLISLFYSFDGRRGFSDPILYNFSHGGAWKRLTVHSDFYGRAGGREFFTVEVIGDHIGRSTEQADQDFRQHTADNGLLVGQLSLEGSHVLEHAYPIYTAGAGERSKRNIARLREFGLESFGRQGAFQYQPTARVSTREAERILGAR
ncbi:NAD(P)-binding protein [Blastococcus saxobsidens]|uniref:Putative NAD(P)-binding protein n=1 Tax=Blastococcus saxobsidens TaxID=138336 RepID=A0A4Q7YBT5_9ACTN|nr:NAD(P)-binding protein [Blastococcus saxobsidens]RZU34084.1 putative NAD(P)-binding protein [Blastococcus saxobsidens]